MAKRIDTVFTADPNAGNDPSKTASVAVDFGTSTEEAYSLEQISSVVANRLGISENLPDQATFSARFPDNSLIATVDPIQTAYEYYVINTTGTTPTSGGSTGALAFTAADYDSYTYYLFISDDDSSYTQVEPADSDPNNDGLDPPGLILKAKYLLAPPAITDLAIDTPVAGSGELDITFTAPTVVDGTDSTIAYVVRTDTGTDVNTYTGVTSPATLGNLPIDVELSVTVVVTANNSEVSVSNLAIETIPASTSNDYDGEIYIVAPANAITDQTVDDITRYQEVEASPVKITLGLRNRQTTSGDKTSVTVEVQTLNDTALSGTNYTALSTQTVTFTLDGTTDELQVEQNVVTIDNDEPEHNAFQFQLIPGSVGAVGGDPATGEISVVLTDQSVMAYILGTGGPDATAFEISNTLTDGTETNKTGFILNATDFTSKSSGAATGSQDLTQYALATTVSGMTYLAGNNFDHMGSEATAYPYDPDPLLSYKVNAPRLDFECDFGTGNQGTYWLYARVYSNRNYRNTIWLGMDSNTSWSTGESGEVRLGSSSFERWDWAPVKDAAGDRVTYTITSDGIKIFNVWKNDANTWYDRFLLVNSETFNPSAHGTAGTSGGTPDAYGDSQNSKVAGSAITDNPNNGTITNPIPPTGVLVPTFNPLDGAAGVGTTAGITLTFEAGANTIQVTSFVESEYSDSNVVINGVYSNQPASNLLFWSPLSSRADNTRYKIIASGTVVDNAGAVKNWSVVLDDLDYTTLNPAAGNVIITLNPSQWPADHDMTRDEVKAWIGTDGATNTMAHIDNGGVRNVIDPFGSGEKVWKIRFDEGFNGTLNSGIQLDASLNDLGEVYIMMDAAYCNKASDGVDFVFPASIHGPKLRCQTAIGPWGCSMQCTGSNLSIVEQWAAVGETYPYLDTYIDGICFDYEYTQQGNAGARIPNTLDPTIYSNVDKQYQLAWKRGVYTQVEMYAKMNTGNTNNAVIKMWIDGVLRLNRTGFRFIADDDPEYGKGFSGYNIRFWSGGPIGNVKYLHTQTQWNYVKNFIVSTDPITH